MMHSILCCNAVYGGYRYRYLTALRCGGSPPGDAEVEAKSPPLSGPSPSVHAPFAFPRTLYIVSSSITSLRKMQALTVNAKLSNARASVCARPARRSLVVRAEEAAAAPKKEAPKAWTAPTLDPNTPSPIFGGSTGTRFHRNSENRTEPLPGRCLPCTPTAAHSGSEMHRSRHPLARVWFGRVGDRIRLDSILLPYAHRLTPPVASTRRRQAVCCARRRLRSSTSSPGRPRRSRSSRCRLEEPRS